MNQQLAIGCDGRRNPSDLGRGRSGVRRRLTAHLTPRLGWPAGRPDPRDGRARQERRRQHPGATGARGVLASATRRTPGGVHWPDVVADAANRWAAGRSDALDRRLSWIRSERAQPHRMLRDMIYALHMACAHQQSKSQANVTYPGRGDRNGGDRWVFGSQISETSCPYCVIRSHVPFLAPYRARLLAYRSHSQRRCLAPDSVQYVPAVVGTRQATAFDSLRTGRSRLKGAIVSSVMLRARRMGDSAFRSSIVAPIWRPLAAITSLAQRTS